MAEQLDPILETRLRAALRDEADAVPFTLRAGELERLAGQRRRAQRAQGLSVLAMAAVVVVAVAGVAAMANLRATGPVAPGKLAGLASYDQLVAAGGGAPEVLRAESDAIAGDGQWQYGLPTGGGSLKVVVACLGGPLSLATASEGAAGTGLGSVACSGAATTVSVGTDPAIAAASSPSIRLNAPGGTAWRMIVFSTTASASPAGPPPTVGPSDAIWTLPSYAELMAASQSHTRLSWYEAPEQPITIGSEDPLGHGFTGFEVVLACRGAAAGAVVEATTTQDGVPSPLSPFSCDGTPQRVVVAVDAATLDNRLAITVPALTAVRYVVLDASASINADPTGPLDRLPTWDELFAAAPAGATRGAEGGFYSAGSRGVQELALGGMRSPALVAACSGAGLLGLGQGSLAVAVAPGSGPDGEAQVGVVTCDARAHVLTWNPAAEPPGMAQVHVAAPAGLAWMGLLVDLAGAGASSTPEPSHAATEPSLEPPLAGSTALVSLDLTAADGTVERTAARPQATDYYLLSGACAGQGSVDLVIDGVEGTWACGTLGVEPFTLGSGTTATIHATVTGTAHFLVRLDARDMAAIPNLTFLPPALSLTGPDSTAGDTVTTAGFPGCGWSWQPKSGVGGFNEDCGPSWQAMATALHQRPGTTVTMTLPAGWTIDAIDAAVAANADILPSGSHPAEQPLAVSHPGGAWSFRVPGSGDWGVRLTVTAARDGDTFNVPFYGRVIVEP